MKISAYYICKPPYFTKRVNYSLDDVYPFLSMRNSIIAFYGRTNSGKTYNTNLLLDRLEYPLKVSVWCCLGKNLTVCFENLTFQTSSAVLAAVRVYRKTISTQLNDTSSREHLYLYFPALNLHVLDLCGNEPGDLKANSTLINGDLLNFYSYICAKSSYRNCQLTKILNCNVAKVKSFTIIGCIDRANYKLTLEYCKKFSTCELKRAPKIKKLKPSSEGESDAVSVSSGDFESNNTSVNDTTEDLLQAKQEMLERIKSLLETMKTL